MNKTILSNLPINWICVGGLVSSEKKRIEIEIPPIYDKAKIIRVIIDEVVKSRSHTKITENTKKNLNVFNRPFFVPLCLRGEKLTFMKPS